MDKLLNGVPVVVSGATGRMGREIVRTVLGQVGFDLAGAIGHARSLGEDIGELCAGEPCGVLVTPDIDEALKAARGGILIEVSTGTFVKEVVLKAIEYDVACIVGTTGVPGFDMEEISAAAAAKRHPVLFAPNFAMGAVLMMKFAKMASKYFRWAEIIEKHHDRKFDAPSGTALYTAEAMARASGGGFRSPVEGEESVKGVRGGKYSGIRIHSMRMPGFLASQDVVFGGQGETLTISHNTINRDSFMSGVVLAMQKVRSLEGLTVGLENLID
ncbi:4-hydroxy-tetrahydrodipicolinate reductase [bacterium]|nr:4-hydroxy-tetrahydrodipicolinate reductase [bacterium]